MSGASGKWREDQVLVICPGSKTTMAQLGCGDLTPPAHRIPTRMFGDDESDGYRPFFVEKRKKASAGGANGVDQADEYEYIEDPDSDEGAVYPIRAGRIVNMAAFLAFLDYVHGLLTTTFHNTPIMLMASPQWTRPDCEAIARYIFEKTKTPALCLIHSAVATQYGLKWPSMTVVDIGFEKVDVTCIYDSKVVGYRQVSDPLDGEPGEAISGGEVFTRKLLGLLKDKEFTYEMVEQLKKSHICEVLPYVPDAPKLMELPKENATQAASAAPPPSTVIQEAQDVPDTLEPARPPLPVPDADEDMGTGDDKPAETDDGVLDVASIVTSGQTKEFLAKKEKEKVEKIKAKKQAKGQEPEAAAGKAARLPNSKRMRNMFHYEELNREPAPEEVETNAQEVARPEATAAATEPGVSEPASGDVAASAEGQTKAAADDSKDPGNDGQEKAPEKKPDAPMSFFPSAEPPPPAASSTERAVKRIRRDIEVGLERFTFADRAEIDRIVTAIYHAVQGIEDMYMRPSCWEHIVFVGNGGRLRGLRENIIQTLNARHLVSPSTATMFTSELPSNLGTPSGTGSQTPVGSFTGPPHQLPNASMAGPTSSGVNPLLRDAVTAASLGVSGGGMTPGMHTAGSNAGDANNGGMVSSHFHSQTPTAIKLAALPAYLGEWTKNGYEEAMFLGAQVAARLAFCMHNLNGAEVDAQRLMSLNRIEFNEYGPKAIRTHSMLGW
ncbi:hypothetical protein GGTG_03446 [Gaeumannomyces tritici R3-111a-1]|uniref:Uncharacterized protein n=1 Tax=Gaeumannomyces tritici (strain R3-111a-1) TaxID=644352 RepID=J3NQ89_GAET3|nr:hypothetical protein GGTG_03446 [Gaeumannomyces tritici R3-111a-1]EJT78345.1 hypothetical protein GGTG_03446 [Gaeumannomyces tritici R3-111a-1]